MIKILIIKLIALFVRSRSAAMQSAAQKLAAAKRELRRMERAIRRAPNRPAQTRARRQYQRTAQLHADKFSEELDPLAEARTEIEDEFVETYFSFEEEPPRRPNPHRVEKYEARARAFKLACVAVTLIEMTLAFYQARLNGYGVVNSLFLSAFVTMLMVALAHGAMAATARRMPNDIEALLRWVLWPSLVISILMLAVFFLFRSLTGNYLTKVLLGWLQPLNDIALWVATLGLIPTGTAFLSLSMLLGWSGRLTRRYDQVRRLETELEGYRRELLALANPEDDPDDFPPPPPPALPQARRTPASFMSLLLCMVIGTSALLTGCGDTSGQTVPSATAESVAPAISPAASAAARPELHIMVDASQSPDPEVAESGARRFHGQLGDTVLATGAGRVGIIVFDVDGWQALEKSAVDLPPFVPPTLEPFEPSKLPPHLEVERRKRYEEEQAERIRQAKDAHAAAVRQALAAISLSALLPPKLTKKQPRCSDISGALKRITQKASGRKHYWILLTDARHSCGGSQMQPAGTWQGEGKALLLWVPANTRESRGQRAEAQFADRVEVLRKVAPWLLVQRADEGDPVRAFGLAEAQAERQAQVTENISQNN